MDGVRLDYGKSPMRLSIQRIQQPDLLPPMDPVAICQSGEGNLTDTCPFSI
ncbi:Uncharacterised protein [Klebsiella variicola]|nr:Uncharacterised protein [Klebsiella variicola]